MIFLSQDLGNVDSFLFICVFFLKVWSRALLDMCVGEYLGRGGLVPSMVEGYPVSVEGGKRMAWASYWVGPGPSMGLWR